MSDTYPAPSAPSTTSTAGTPAPTTATTAATTHAGGLPVTGGDVLALTCLGFALLAAGLFTMLVRRASRLYGR